MHACKERMHRAVYLLKKGKKEREGEGEKARRLCEAIDRDATYICVAKVSRGVRARFSANTNFDIAIQS